MTKWAPPIPAERLYSGPAIAIGTALPVLIWCYDGVDRECTVQVQVSVLAADLGQPYRTVKTWWAAVMTGPWFNSVIDQGRRGYRCTFDPDWIDWRVFAANYPGQVSESSRPVQGPDSALENTPAAPAPSRPVQGPDSALNAVSTPASIVQGPDSALETIKPLVQGPVKAPSRPDEGPDSALEQSGIKVLMISASNDHDSCAAPIGADTPKPKRGRKKKTDGAPAASDPTPLPIRQALAAACNIDMEHAPDRSMINLNKTAKAVWAMQQDRGKTEQQTVKAIGMVAEYCQATVYPYSNGQPLKPVAIHEHWDAARIGLSNGTYQQGTQAGMVSDTGLDGVDTAASPGAAANAAAIARSGKGSERGPLRAATIGWTRRT